MDHLLWPLAWTRSALGWCCLRPCHQTHSPHCSFGGLSSSPICEDSCEDCSGEACLCSECFMQWCWWKCCERELQCPQKPLLCISEFLQATKQREGVSELAVIFDTVVLLQLKVPPDNEMLLHPFTCSQHKPTKQWVRSQTDTEKPAWRATKSL